MVAVLVGVAVGVVVGHDGSPGWLAARVLAVAGVTAALVVALGDGRSSVRRSARFCAGLAAVPVGLGIGVPHLAKGGPGLVTVAGLAILAGGLALVVTGTVGLLRATPHWWGRLVVAPGLLLAVMVATSVLGQAVAATNVPRTGLGTATPADRGLAYRDVAFGTADGVRLSGWYIPSANGAGVVLAHGAGSTRSSVLDHAAVLARAGYGVVLFDARGHGRSGGRAMDFGWYGDQDVGAAVSFLAAQPDIDGGRIAAVGLSMGGEEVIGAAAGDPRIRAVVAEGATNRVAADKAWLSDVYGWRGAVQERIEALLYGAADLLTAAHPPVALRAAVATVAPRPVLLVAAGAVAEEGHADRYIQAGSPQTVALWVVPGATHTAGLRTRPTEWEQRVSAFLADALRPARQVLPAP